MKTATNSFQKSVIYQTFKIMIIIVENLISNLLSLQFFSFPLLYSISLYAPLSLLFIFYFFGSVVYHISVIFYYTFIYFNKLLYHSRNRVECFI